VFARHHPENVLNHCTKGVENAFMAGIVQYGGSFSLDIVRDLREGDEQRGRRQRLETAKAFCSSL
jgi:hypothetical protein